MSVQVEAASLAVDGGPGGDDDQRLRRLAEGLLAAGVHDLAVDLSRSQCDAARAADLLIVLAELQSRLSAAGGRLRITGVSTPQLMDALAAAPLSDVFAIYTAVRGKPPVPGGPVRHRLGGAGSPAVGRESHPA